jgi:hypothetical protein
VPGGNCGKRFVLSKPLWESAFWADFHQRRQFPPGIHFFLFCSFFLSFCLFSVFHRKISRQECLRATIPNPVDLQHPPVRSLRMFEKTHGGSSRIHGCIRLSLELFRWPIAQRRM